MEKVALGKTGIAVSRLCFGTLTIGPLQRNLPIKEGASLLELAFSNGVNFIDAAEIYGTYPYIKAALGSAPKDLVICTKSYAYDAAGAEQSFRSAQKEMGREYIDVFLVHEQQSEHTLRGHWDAIEYYLKKQQEGLIGAVGISTHYVAAVRAANKLPEIGVIEPLINKTGLGIADGSLGEMLAAIEESHALGKGIVTMKPLGGGNLILQREKAFEYMLSLSCVDSVAVGMQSEAEVLFNCRFFEGAPVDNEIIKGLAQKTRELMIQDWCVGCGACVKRCRNKALRIAGGKARVDKAKCAVCGYCATACNEFCIKVL